jgi:hypothetical protein
MRMQRTPTARHLAPRARQIDRSAGASVERLFEIGEFVQRVGIVKRALVAKPHFDVLVARVPRANPAFPGIQIGGEIVGERGAYQCDDGMKYDLPSGVDGRRNGGIGLLGFERGEKPVRQVVRQGRRIAGRAQDQFGLRRAQPGQQSGQRPRKIAGRILDDTRAERRAEPRVFVQMTIRADQQGAGLRGEAPGDVQRERLAGQWLQALVESTHARAAAARQNEAGDARARAGIHRSIRWGGRR